ncbi:GGDEF domain-containing protein [Pelagibacterium mangrovi]|uniref:GGDEF domain-containing protein n=1 Tax=Pelagibacterium mangrovi TaxID=3119828 RepID=UPI002FC60FE2
MKREFRLPRQAWAKIAIRTTKYTVFAVIISAIVSSALLEIFSQGINEVGLIAAVVAPIILGGPMVFGMTMRQFQLQMAYERLEAAAARDSLTNCFNHGAFVEAATAALTDEANPGGTLLVIDADHFKSINDRFGHASGDTALKLIVTAIAASVEPQDIIGRLGGEEFGVLLHGSDIEPARSTAEAIRQAVRKIEFTADDQSCTLSVSIGGAIAQSAVDFGGLFRLADERLYKVKQTGRNGIDIVAMPTGPSVGAGRLYREPKIKLRA